MADIARAPLTPMAAMISTPYVTVPILLPGQSTRPEDQEQYRLFLLTDAPPLIPGGHRQQIAK